MMSSPDILNLARAILEGGPAEMLEALTDFLTARDHRALADELELCPLHGVDQQICRDDDTRCQPPKEPT